MPVVWLPDNAIVFCQFPHSWLPGYIEKWWNSDRDHPPWKPETGLVRRPDVIIVKDPTKAHKHDNIKQVVEIKFADDVWGDGQEKAYRAIGGPDRLAELTPDKCECPEPEPEQPSEKKSEKGVIDYLMDFVDAAEEADRIGGERGRTRPKRRPRK